ncbi:MAG: nucleotidyltransferase family protein, partial [Armatimonadetes bacterium]|nr:nucleotidyltransferase family protein [Armatimonadota bacterium]
MAAPFSLQLPPDERLLLACAAPPELHDPEHLARLAAAVTDWPAFTEKTLQAKFAPLVFSRLSELDLRRTIPRPLFMRLAAAQVAADGAARRFLAERDRILGTFAEAGISALPLKGCALADTLYGDPSLRPMGDLDLLLRNEGFDAAMSTLSGFGYRTDGVDPRGETFFYHPEHHLFIDAHTALDPSGRFRIPVEELWDAAAPLPRSPQGGGNSPPEWQTLSVQHHVAHGLLHAARHRLDSLGPLVDVTWLAARWPDA